MKKKKRTRIILISILLVVLIAGGVFFVYKRLNTPKPPEQVQDKNSNTYKQNEELFDESDNNQSGKSNNTSNLSQVTKPTLVKSASTAPANVSVDFTCVGTEGVDCYITLTNTSNGQVISLDKQKITRDRVGQTTAYWVWQTVVGKWQVVATATNSSSQASSDAQTLEVK
ncbi:MAG TPA: hypothetical protein PKC05_04220 [Candidatus Saccharibacteria bacterium]|nr:hypothetical protein [Candidatus Saccharibacteria bacterium]